MAGTIEEYDNTPESNEVWSGIGGHFDNICQILCEFIDNSISNYKKNNSFNRTIDIAINELPEHKVQFVIEDCGSGILHPCEAFTLGNKKYPDSPLNEHGFGLKHALASANPSNDSWHVYTRTEEDIKNNQYREISAPYRIGKLKAEIKTGWPGNYSNKGTIISFTCDWNMFKSIVRGVYGNYVKFETIVPFFAEELGFIYSGLIKKDSITIRISPRSLDGEMEPIFVTPVEPLWERDIQPGIGSFKDDLGGGRVTIEYHFGFVSKNNSLKKYYQCSMSTSGVEIRLNGRVLAYNLFKEIWSLEKHNSYNPLLIIINIISDKPEALPQTRTSKNGIREGDDKIEKVYSYIRSVMDKPPKVIEHSTDEKELFKELCDAKNYHVADPKRITTEMNTFNALNEKVRIDLYDKEPSITRIYEGKLDKTTPQDAYQLMMYWDGCVYDKIHIDEAILIAANHPDSVKKIVEEINNRTDATGRNYNMKLKKWVEEGIPYKSKKNKL